MHNRFGKGEILDLDGPVDGKMATIRFEAHGEKRLLLKFAKLEILG
jgi:DNA helicase-2/ATP-dependent DNA helicase PcrA